MTGAGYSLVAEVFSSLSDRLELRFTAHPASETRSWFPYPLGMCYWPIGGDRPCDWFTILYVRLLKY